jgi:hypothetical protein
MRRRSVARNPVTIRFPKAVLAAARTSKGRDESFNDLVVAAVEREAKRRESLTRLAELDELRRTVWAGRGKRPSSAPMIRAMREGRLRR